MKWKADRRLGELVRSWCHCVVSEFDFCNTSFVDISYFSIGEVGGHWVGRAGRSRPGVRSGFAHILTNILVFLGTFGGWCNTIFISTSSSTPHIGTLLLLLLLMGVNQSQHRRGKFDGTCVTTFETMEDLFNIVIPIPNFPSKINRISPCSC